MASPTPELMSLMRASKIFQRLSDDIIKRVIDVSDIFTYNKDAVILCKQQLNSNMFFVITGTLEVSLPSGNDSRDFSIQDYVIANLKPGDSFGEYSFYDNQPTMAKVRSVTPSSLLITSYLDIEKIFDSDLPMGRCFYHNLLTMAIYRARDNNEKRKDVGIWDINFCR